MPNDHGTEDPDECGLIVEAAMEAASERCASEEAMFEQVNKFFGSALDAPAEEERERPQPEDCDAVLEDGLGPDDLRTVKNQRRYAMCRAWEILQDPETNVSFRQAISEAWDEVDAAEEELEITPEA